MARLPVKPRAALPENPRQSRESSKTYFFGAFSALTSTLTAVIRY